MIVSRDGLKYTINVELSDVVARARFFFYYPGLLSYMEGNGCGLLADVNGVAYDDWMCEARPPRIDAHKFNTEIIVPLSNGDNEISFSDNFADDSESFLENGAEVTDPINILVEFKDWECGVSKIKLAPSKEVMLELSLSGTGSLGEIRNGTAVTIYNSLYADSHVLGPNGNRICGTYRIEWVSGNWFKCVGNYATVASEMILDGSQYTVSKWTACHYDVDNIEITKNGSESAIIDASDLPVGVAPGDYLYVGGVMCRVLMMDDNDVIVDARMSETSMRVDVKYSPRIPSAAIPVNWSTTPYLVRSSGEGIILANTSGYDHTSNTAMLTPVVDTYFENTSDAVNYSASNELVVSSGSNESIVCMQFAPNTIVADDMAAAKLSLYVNGMSYSEAMIVVYQMDSVGWSAAMSYDEIMSHVTGIPIGTVEIHNPTMVPMNQGLIDHTVYGEFDDIKNRIDIDLESSIIEQWMTGSAAYSPSIAIRVVSDGNPSISLASTNDADSSKVPYILLTGGELDENPVPFTITLSSDSAEPSQVLRITPEDVSAHNFGDSIFSNVVQIGDEVASVISGNSTYMDVVVPKNVGGSVSVIVYRRKSDSSLVPITDGETHLYVNSSATERNIPLAKKLQPGVIDANRVGRSALYNRDMGFTNMTEVTDETSLLQNVYSILLTNPGERLFSQSFGTGIEQRLFRLGSREEGISLIQECIQKVGTYEPRVFIDGDQSACEFDDSENAYYLLLCVVLPSSRTEMIRLPFKNRGRMV